MRRSSTGLAFSRHASEFALKGGHLFAIWDARRPTNDVDLGHDYALAADELVRAIREIAETNVDDGVAFLAMGVVFERAFRGLPEGARVAVPARVGSATIRLKIDVMFGQPVTPGTELRWLHGMLGCGIAFETSVRAA